MDNTELIFKALCSYFQYYIKCSYTYDTDDGPVTETGILECINIFDKDVFINGHILDIKENNIRPYLRPMSSITQEEHETIVRLAEGHDYEWCAAVTDYLNSIYIDYNNLTEKGLAFVAPENMYK